MSSWPEAVWIVRKLQKNFDFTARLNSYTDQLNNIGSTINNLISRVETDENELKERVTTFMSTKDSNGKPTNPPPSYGKGTIWLIIKD